MDYPIPAGAKRILERLPRAALKPIWWAAASGIFCGA